MPKVAVLFITALSEQDVAKSHDNDVFVFDSSSAILKMERRKDKSKSTAHEQRFFRRAIIVPYHGDNPNTRNGARLRSPSPIMAPAPDLTILSGVTVTHRSIWD